MHGGAPQHPWLKQQGVAPDRPLDNIVLARMKKFAAMNKLKKAALLVIAKSLNPDEIRGLQQLFRSIDVDNSGTITVDELRTAMRSLDSKLNVRKPFTLLRFFVASHRPQGCGNPMCVPGSDVGLTQVHAGCFLSHMGSRKNMQALCMRTRSTYAVDASCASGHDIL